MDSESIEKYLMIRKSNEMDYEQIGAIHKAAFQAAYQKVLPIKFMNQYSENYFLEYWKRYVNSHEIVTYVFILKGLIAGFITYENPRVIKSGYSRKLEVKFLYVHPKYWRNRIGSKLLYKVITDVISQDIEIIYGWTFENNKQIETFCHTFGANAENTECYYQDKDQSSAIKQVKYGLRLILKN